MAVVNFKSAMPSMGGASATSKGSGSSMTKYLILGLILAGAGYVAYNYFMKPKATIEDDY